MRSSNCLFSVTSWRREKAIAPRRTQDHGLFHGHSNSLPFPRYSQSTTLGGGIVSVLALVTDARDGHNWYVLLIRGKIVFESACITAFKSCFDVVDLKAPLA